MSPKGLLAVIALLAGSVLLVLGWLILEGGAEPEAMLFFLLGLPVAAGALWWSGRRTPPHV